MLSNVLLRLHAVMSAREVAVEQINNQLHVNSRLKKNWSLPKAFILQSTFNTDGGSSGLQETSKEVFFYCN